MTATRPAARDWGQGSQTWTGGRVNSRLQQFLRSLGTAPRQSECSWLHDGGGGKPYPSYCRQRPSLRGAPSVYAQLPPDADGASRSAAPASTGAARLAAAATVGAAQRASETGTRQPPAPPRGQRAAPATGRPARTTAAAVAAVVAIVTAAAAIPVAAEFGATLAPPPQTAQGHGVARPTEYDAGTNRQVGANWRDGSFKPGAHKCTSAHASCPSHRRSPPPTKRRDKIKGAAAYRQDATRAK